MFRSDWQHGDPDSSGSDDDDAFTQSYLAASAARPPPNNNGRTPNTSTTQSLLVVRETGHDNDDAKRSSIEALLSPVQAELRRLRNTTSPPYNPHVHSKSVAQVLKERLVPIGRHIVELLETVLESEKGGLEMDLCEYIAQTYWPTEVTEASGPEVLEMYRNALLGGAVEWEMAMKGEETWKEDGGEGKAGGEVRDESGDVMMSG